MIHALEAEFGRKRGPANAPRTLAPQSQAPRINLQINVNARQLSPTDYEVSLLMEGGAGEGAD